jgi:DNA-binding NarL/FixJ family response regulator
MNSTPVRRPLKIFLVEDSTMIQERLTTLLSPIAGACVVGVAPDPQSAVDAIARTEADVVILDISLLGGSGMQVLHALADSPRPITKIVLTNFAIAPFREKCLAAGAHYFFDKTRDFMTVRDTVRRIADTFETASRTNPSWAVHGTQGKEDHHA